MKFDKTIGGEYQLKDGKLTWVEKEMPKQRRVCTQCQEFFIGNNTTCQACHATYMREYRRREHTCNPHEGAFTHVIRNEETMEIFKFSCIDNELPKGYTIITKAEAGQLIPKIYWEERNYHEAQNSTK